MSQNPTDGTDPADQPTVEVPASTPPPAAPAPAAPVAPEPVAAAPVMASVPPRTRRFGSSRPVQLIAVGVLGAILGGGVVGVAGLALHHHGRDGRPMVVREHNNGKQRLQDRRDVRPGGGNFQRGPRFNQQVPAQPAQPGQPVPPAQPVPVPTPTH